MTANESSRLPQDPSQLNTAAKYGPGHVTQNFALPARPQTTGSAPTQHGGDRPAYQT